MYCTQSDLINRFGETELLQLTDRNRTGVIDDVVVAQAIADAGAEIDGYICSRVDLPLAEDDVPALLRLYACDIARYRLFDDGAFEQVTERYNIALRYLRDVAGGKVQLLPTAAADEAENAAEFVSGRESVFGSGGY